MSVRSTRRSPTLRSERALIGEGALLVGGMDEVGRGALAGPVSVGLVVVDAGTRTAPRGLTDSKLLSPSARENMVDPLRRWAVAWAVGHAGPAEIDAHGIVAALRLAGRRALAQVRRTAGDVDVVLLDGSHDWLSRPHADLFEAADLDPSRTLDAPEPGVRTLVKADLQCSSVAAASVLAKVERDGLLRRLAAQYPAFAWEQNKGYSAPAHLEALRRHGPTPQHRRSWNLRVLDDTAPAATAAAAVDPPPNPAAPEPRVVTLDEVSVGSGVPLRSRVG
ncbi:RNase HII [Isoptericola sp. CG 20/1183]|uniref:Ribonuclease n=1 Tax=Isoptericola halotolerans TaxID=300560 RepID=A0ABX5ECV7_9MICO|nr:MULTISPECIES: ribonuclease HII [Isoptericola]PRZ05671.1 RNase HII [Isoptericola halotolerans]PRZ06239.1 RNase HII [Isoptericola sp. CG 20/1183]